MSLTAVDLLNMSQDELDELFASRLPVRFREERVAAPPFSRPTPQ